MTTLPEGWTGDFQLVFLLAVYAYILYIGCSLISDGSELLMLTKYSKLVGSTVLPVLGAVPDGAIVLFSGIGPAAQTQLDVGIGALAGSTVMLVTIPWFLAILGGRVNIDADGVAKYSVPKGEPRLKPADSCWGTLTATGVGLQKNPTAVTTMGLWMITTTLPMLIIQAATFVNWSTDDAAEAAAGEKWPALAAFLVAAGGFIAYLAYQYQIAMSDDAEAQPGSFEEKQISNIIAQIKKNQIGLVGAVKPFLREVRKSHAPDYGTGAGEAEQVPSLTAKEMSMISRILKPFFYKYDIDGNSKMSINELNLVFADIGQRLKPAELNTLFAAFDKDKSGEIEFSEFVTGVTEYVFKNEQFGSTSASSKDPEKGEAGDDEEEDEEEDEMPEDLVDLSPEEQQAAVLSRSSYMLLAGTALVMAFSDPLVDCLDEIGDRTGIPDFYVAFVLAPIVTNGSEGMASYTFALKKTSASAASILSLSRASSMVCWTRCRSEQYTASKQVASRRSRSWRALAWRTPKRERQPPGAVR